MRKRILAVVVAVGLVLPGSLLASSLSEAVSPYLRSHVDDPVQWRPWSESALAEAKRDGKLVFVSIGYASCHWCHEMARETFRNQAVAAALNQDYISLLVDRDERPDLDIYFTKILTAINGRSGWPANIMLTPDLIPLFGANFLSPEPRYGDPGFLEVVTSLARTWREDRDSILRNVDDVRAQMQVLFTPVNRSSGVGTDPRNWMAEAWIARLDRQEGGFDLEPKFPQPMALSFLLRQGVSRHDTSLLDSVFFTLDRMAAGGVRDQLGGAFFRYAVDRAWRIPHFEIMLADNALLARLYLEAFQVSGRAPYAAVARAILENMIRRLMLADGSFANALDSESADEEGAFYTWSEKEVEHILPAAEARNFITTALDEKQGALRGRGIPRQRGVAEIEDATRVRLLAAREERPAPVRDESVLTSTNALAASAFAKAAQILGDERYLTVARRIVARISDSGESLRHSRRGDVLGEDVFLDDYAALILARLDLYETDFDVHHLEEAESLAKTMMARFSDNPGRPFRLTPSDRASSIVGMAVLDEEGGQPSGNALALTALRRLALYGDDSGAGARAADVLGGLSGSMAAPGLMQAFYFGPMDAVEAVIVGRLKDNATTALIREVHQRLLPGLVLAVIDPDHLADAMRWPLLADRTMINGKATAYLCRDRRCDWPVTTAAAFVEQLKAGKP